jgi:hypothetical protein
MSHGKLVVAVGSESPVATVIYHGESPPLDSGYTVLFADAPEELPDLDDPCLHTVCLHCLIELHPEAGRGLDLAKKHGTADRDPETGEWFAGD